MLKKLPLRWMLPLQEEAFGSLPLRQKWRCGWLRIKDFCKWGCMRKGFRLRLPQMWEVMPWGALWVLQKNARASKDLPLRPISAHDDIVNGKRKLQRPNPKLWNAMQKETVMWPRVPSNLPLREMCRLQSNCAAIVPLRDSAKKNIML